MSKQTNSRTRLRVLFAGLFTAAIMMVAAPLTWAQVPEAPAGEEGEEAAPEVQEQEPAAAVDLITLLEEEGNFSMLISELQRTGLADSLAAAGSYTLFAPTDDAFALLTEGQDGELSPAQLAGLLRYHIVPEAYTAQQLATAGDVPTRQGKAISIGADGKTIAGAKIVKADLETDNGVVHVIDKVFPASVETIRGAQ